MKKVRFGEEVVVYDRYRFSIPLNGILVGKSDTNDGVEIVLLDTNNINYPIGCRIWVSLRQIRKAE